MVLFLGAARIQPRPPAVTTSRSNKTAVQRSSGLQMPSINDLFNNFTLRKTLLALRLPIALALAALLLLNIDPHWFWPGFVVSFVGMLLQLWIFGCIKTREVLAVDGPYMFVRNPMYIARFLLIFGLVLMTGSPVLLLVFVPLYYFYMINRVEREEPVLLDAFGTKYMRYCKHVPRFVPRLTPYPKGRFFYFRMRNFERQHGMLNLLAFSAFYIACYVVAFHLP